MVRLKSAQDVRAIYRSGQVAGLVLDEVASVIKPGVTTRAVDELAAGVISKHGATAAFLGYRGFPASTCVSVNEEIVHGIPGDRELTPGDLVSIDVGVVLDGYYSDAARSYFVGDGQASDDARRLSEATRESRDAGIAAMIAGRPLRDVSRAVEQVLSAQRLAIIRELTGHGTGFALHEEPTVYNFDPGSRLPLVENGLVLAIEPMASLGSAEIILGADKWTYRTADGSLAAHFEHTVVCWEGQPVVLTDTGDEKAKALFG